MDKTSKTPSWLQDRNGDDQQTGLTASPTHALDGCEKTASDWAFFKNFLAFTAAGLVMLCAVVGLLGIDNRLPAAPLTATNCIDEKLGFLRNRSIEETTLLAIGSSATWRNLDMESFVHQPSGATPLNAATCYLHVDQTAFLLKFLLSYLPNVESIVVVLAPRDFTNCAPEDTKIFEPLVASLYFDGWLPAWALHALNFRLPYYAEQAIAIKKLRQPDSKTPVTSDKFGSSPLRETVTYEPPLVLDERCFEALVQLQEIADASGAQLSLATIPVMPDWKARHDPDGEVLGNWKRRIKSRLSDAVAFIDGSDLHLPTEKFADSVHLLKPAVREFSDFLANRMSTMIGFRLD